MYLEIKDMKKSFGSGESYNQVLKGITTNIEQGQMCVIQGNSGSGKSTMLNCIGGLDTMDSGSVKVDGNEISGLNADELSEYRRANLGFIFQFYNLVSNLTVKENIEICQFLTEDPLDMEELLDTLGLTEHQDEPTGALDSTTSKDILILLEKINQQYGTTMLIVTHNNAIRNMVHKVIIIKDGQISEDYENETRLPAKSLEDL